MTIYLYIDLPFNEIGSYPTFLRDLEKKRRKKIRGGEGKAGQLLKWQPISCFSIRLLSTRIQSNRMGAGKYSMSEPMGCIQAGVLFHIYLSVSFKPTALISLHKSPPR